MLIYLYLFLISAIRSYHKLSDLKQNKFSILQSWRSEVQNRFYWAGNWDVGRAACLLEALGEPVIFPASRDSLHCLPCVPLLPSSKPTVAGQVFLLLHHSEPTLPPSLSLERTHEITLGSPWWIRIISPSPNPQFIYRVPLAM